MAVEETEGQENEETAKKSSSSTLKIIIIAVMVTVILGGGLVAATLYFVDGMNPTESSADKDDTEAEETEEGEEEDEAESVPAAPAQYFSMDPKFMVSFKNQNKARFMQFSLEVMSRDSDVIKKIEAHMPVVRSSLLMLFGSQEYEAMVTREGKEKLLADTTADINATLQKVTGEKDPESSVEEAYFTSFVIQ